MEQNGATAVGYPSKRKKQSKKKEGGQQTEASSESHQGAIISQDDQDSAENESPISETGLEGTVEKMALEDGPRKLEDDNTNNVAKVENNKPGVVNGGMGDSGVMKELLVKQQEKTKELEERLKQLTQEWNKEKSELQKELEGAKEAHQRDLVEGDERLAKVEDEKRQLSEQYKNLLDKVSTLKERMGEKLKADADALAEARSTAAELEEQNILLTNQLDELRTEYRKLNEESTDVIREAANLRNRLNLSQQNWVKEREELISQEKHLHEEYATTKQAMQDWEVIAMEERSMRESLADRLVELEEQLTAFKTGYEKAISERDRETATIDGLQRALMEIQEARKIELREITESMQGSIDQLTEKSQAMEQRAIETEAQLLKSQDDLERFQQFEKEVKEKNLLIGKLRHEAVTLNDHLTKALRMLKKGSASDNVDKQLVSNVFLSFLNIQRGDAKKFEVLQLIASVLDWNDEQRERAGLARPGTSSTQNTLPTPQGSFSRASSPLMPYHRTPSTPSLSDPYDGSRELWSSVLDSPQTPSSNAKPF